MFPTAVAASLSYFRSSNPLLRRNVVILLVEILSYTQTTDTDMVTPDIISTIIQEMVNLIRDPDKEVRRVAAEQLGKILLLSNI